MTLKELREAALKLEKALEQLESIWGKGEQKDFSSWIDTNLQTVADIRKGLFDLTEDVKSGLSTISVETKNETEKLLRILSGQG